MAESGLDSRKESRAMRQGCRGYGFDPTCPCHSLPAEWATQYAGYS
jgi:hypothetical protein